MNEALERFGQIVARGRDRGLDVLEAILTGVSKAPARAAIADALGRLNADQREAVRIATRAAVDSTVHKILFEMFEDEAIELVVNGTNLREVSDGLHGDYPTANGWIGRYSNHPE